jgi:hypothetical protein
MVDRDTAIEIARKRAEENGWAFIEPLEVIERKAWFGNKSIRFDINTGMGYRGANARFEIDAATGEIISEGYIPR